MATDDGRCAVCRRQEQETDAKPSPSRVYLGIGAAFAILFAVGIGYRAMQSRHEEAKLGPPATDAERAAALEQVHVTVYTTSWCPHCRRAKQYLQRNNIPFEERDVERDAENRRAARKLSASGGVPLLDVEGEVLEGFDERTTADAIARAATRKLHR